MHASTSSALLQSLLLLLLAPAAINGHFTLQTPASIGYLDVQEGTAPCGSFDIKNRDRVTDFPLAGHPIGMISTHPEAHWEIRVALLNETDKLEFLVPAITQTGLGAFCLPNVPGMAKWVNQDAVVQIIQSAVDGKLYQCAAVKFVQGAAVAPQRDTCRNSSGVAASFTGGTSGGSGSDTTPGNSTNPPAASETPKSGAARAAGALRSILFTMALGGLGFCLV